MCTGGSFPGVKRTEREAGHSPPCSAEVKECGIHEVVVSETQGQIYIYLNRCWKLYVGVSRAVFMLVKARKLHYVIHVARMWKQEFHTEF
jgi:hypothetical protein